MLWQYANFYTVGGLSDTSIEDQMPVWYIMDELDSAIQHSDEANFRVVPFVYIPEQMTYSLMFPVQNVAAGEEVTRDYAEGVTDPLLRKRAL